MSATFWDRWARFYDLSHYTNRRVITAAVRWVTEQIPAGAQVLDCAAGTGEFSLGAAARAKTVLCTDLSLPMLERARKKAAKRGASNIKFARRDMTALPEEDGSFDVVIAANVLHLLEKPEQAVRELWRVTAPAGKLILPTYLQGKTGAAYGTMVKIYQGVGFHYEYAFTPETYRRFLESLDFGRVTLEVIPGRMPEGIGVLKKEG